MSPIISDIDAIAYRSILYVSEKTIKKERKLKTANCNYLLPVENKEAGQQKEIEGQEEEKGDRKRW